MRIYVRKNGELGACRRGWNFFPVRNVLDLEKLRAFHEWRPTEGRTRLQRILLSEGGKVFVEQSDSPSLEYRGIAALLVSALSPEEANEHLLVFEQLSQGPHCDAVQLLKPMMAQESKIWGLTSSLRRASEHLASWQPPEHWSETQISSYVLGVVIICQVGIDEAKSYMLSIFNQIHRYGRTRSLVAHILASVAMDVTEQLRSPVCFFPCADEVILALRSWQELPTAHSTGLAALCDISKLAMSKPASKTIWQAAREFAQGQDTTPFLSP